MTTKKTVCKCENATIALKEIMDDYEYPKTERTYQPDPNNKYQEICELKKVVRCNYNKHKTNDHTIILRIINNHYDGSGIFCYQDGVRLWYQM